MHQQKWNWHTNQFAYTHWSTRSNSSSNSVECNLHSLFFPLSLIHKLDFFFSFHVPIFVWFFLIHSYFYICMSIWSIHTVSSILDYKLFIQWIQLIIVRNNNNNNNRLHTIFKSNSMLTKEIKFNALLLNKQTFIYTMNNYFHFGPRLTMQIINS